MNSRTINKENIRTRFVYNGEVYNKIYLFSVGNIIIKGNTYEELIEKIRKEDPYDRLNNNKYIYK